MQQGVWRVGIVSSITFGCLAIFSPARSQIIPDTTLPSNSTVTPGCTVCTIEGGTVQGVNRSTASESFLYQPGVRRFSTIPHKLRIS
ncbi:MAG TPA: hypothetical protein V6C91_05610 [Coleofasciculaceae cyanobacterium]